MSNIAARSNLYWCAWRWGLSCMMHGGHAARRKRTRCGRDAPAPPRRVHLITIWVVTFYTYSVRGRPPPRRLARPCFTRLRFVRPFQLLACPAGTICNPCACLVCVILDA